MSRLLRWFGGREPQETRVFLVVAAFGIAIGAIYWFVSYEVAGTALLLAFGVANAVVAVALIRAPGARLVRRRALATEGSPDLRPERAELGGGSGTGDVDRPFLDEHARLPGETLAPFALGLGAAIAMTGPIFGIAPVLVGLLPFGWGGWTWLSGARDELEATERAADVDEAAIAANLAEEEGLPVGETPGRAAAPR